MISGKIIFIAPIDWGLGHASRCVPIINELKDHNKIIIGVTEKNDFFFHEYFPDVEQKHITSYNISYSKTLPLWFKLFIQWPFINSGIKKEKLELEKIISDRKIDLVISDNRFGLRSKQIKSIFVTHQLRLKTPVFNAISNWLNKKYIHQFDEVWVPDYEEKGKRLSGDLSDSSEIKIPVKYIGPKSALTIVETEKDKRRYFDYLFLLSGPEPQRTALEHRIFEEVRRTKNSVVIVRGSKTKCTSKPENVEIFDFLTGQQLKEIIVNSGEIICRSGYSSLMDMHLLNKNKLVLIPTPGQTEQEYLATLWQEKFNVRKLDQKEFPEKF